MTMYLAFTAQMVLFSCIPFYLARQNSSIRATSFFCYLCVLLVLANFVGSVYSFPITDTIVISGGTVVYCAFMMTTVLFVIIEKEIRVIRGIIRVVISVNLFLLVFSMAVSGALHSPDILNPFNTSADVFSYSVLITAIGGLLTIAELISLIFLFEKIKARIRNVQVVSTLYIAMFILVLCLDGLLLPLMFRPFDSHWLSDVSNGVAANLVLAVAYGGAMLVFLALFRKRLLEFIGQPLLLGELMGVPKSRLIDEIERKNQSLVLSDQKFRNLAESIDDVFISLDEDLRCTYWNKAAERSGYTSEDVLGKPVFEVFSAPDYVPMGVFYRNVLKSGKPGRAEFVIPQQGQNHDYEFSAYPFGTGISVLVKDVTERKEMEAQLLQSQRMESIGRLAGSVAHDFNNLLVPITANAELGMMHLAPDDKVSIYLQRVTEAAEQAAGLTRQILAFSRKQVLDMQVLDLNVVVSEYSNMIKGLVGENIEIRTTLDSELGLVSADRGQIEQVLLNLVINARDAMSLSGTLTITTANVVLDEPYTEKHGDRQPAGSYSMLMVSDTGHGMDSDVRKNIFEPFFTTKTQGKGTGLGLATVYGIVKQHGGNVWVNSEPGMGSTFKLYFQHATHAVHTTAKAAQIRKVETGTERILLVEDGTMVRNIIREGLEIHGYTVLEAQDVTDGLKLASESDKIDLLLTDVIMPDMNGRELYEKVVALQPAISVLYISGYTDDVIVEQGVLEEGVAFLQKPFSIVNLVQKVKECLNQHVD